MSTPVGAGDSYLVENVFFEDDTVSTFEKVKGEVNWCEMMHKGGPVPRLMSLQADVQPDGTIPLYRHPADEQPDVVAWTPTILRIKEQLEVKVGQTFNHVLIQQYRSGLDYISPHADKTLDILKGSAIVNVSLGATRKLFLKPKKSTKLDGDSNESTTAPNDKIRLSHNTAFVLGWESNLKYLHGINRDKRAEREKSEDELLNNGERISLTFRTVATFLHAGGELTGQGARRTGLPDVDPVTETENMCMGFSEENHSAVFEWDKWYGDGFNVVDLSHIVGIAPDRA